MNPTRILTLVAASSLLALPAYGQGKGNSGNENNNGGGNSVSLPDPLIPAGNLSATPKVVQTGTYPTLSWAIAYPSTITDLVAVSPPGVITVLKNNTYVDVRVVGVGVTECTAGADSSDIHAESRISIDGSDYSQLFWGTNDDVDPTHSLFTKKVKGGTTIKFGGRYDKNNDWSPFVTSASSNFQMVALKNGDTIPTSYDLNQSGRMAAYLKPYVNSDGTVKLGATSLLIVAEYASTDRSQACFDYQDFVLIVNFSGKNNNGHGNNIDGVDSSNPGKGGGGPTGAKNSGEDPSGSIDDEGHIQHQP